MVGAEIKSVMANEAAIKINERLAIFKAVFISLAHPPLKGELPTFKRGGN